jgi:hypothetical protein
METTMLAKKPDLTRLDGGMKPQDDYALDHQPSPGFGENQAFWFFDETNKVHSYNHLDIIQDAFPLRTERHWLALGDGRVLYDYLEGWRSTPTKPAGANLVFDCVEPFKTWTVDYLGTMRVSSADELSRGRPVEGPRAVVQFHIDAEMAAPPWPLGRLDERSGQDMASASGRFIGGERYEQLFRMKGQLRIDNETFEISGTGMRTHRRGSREMASWHGHSWQTALFPSGRAFGLMRFPQEDGERGRDVSRLRFNEGFVVQDGRMYPAQVLESTWLDTFTPIGERSQIRLRSELGEHLIEVEIAAVAWRTIFTDARHGRYLRGFGVWGPETYVMAQGAARYVWDGEAAYGHVERSTAFEAVRREEGR